MSKLNKKYKQIKVMPYKFLPIMVIAFFSINVLSLVLPLSIKKIYSSIILEKSVTSLRLLMIGAFVALSFESIMRKVRDSSSKWIASKYEYQLSSFLIEKVLNSYSKKTEENSYIAELEKFNSLSKIASYYSTRTYQLYIDLPFIGIFLYLIYLFANVLVLVPISIIIVYLLFNVIVGLVEQRQTKDVYVNNDRLMGKVTETLEKIHLVKGAGIEESQINIYKKILEDVNETSYKSINYRRIPTTLNGYISQFTLFSTLIVGGYMMSTNEISFGAITASALLANRSVSPVTSLIAQFHQWKEMKVIRTRIEEMVERPDQYESEVPDFPDKILGSIDIIDLQYSHVQNYSKVRFSGRIRQGDFVYIDPYQFLSYKRVLKKIDGTERIHLGKVLIDNLDISEWNLSSLKGKVEYVDNPVSVYKGTVLENASYFNTSKVENVYAASALTGLDELVSDLPEGFETQLDGQSVNSLPVAFLQRLNLTRALVERPRILIIDRIDENMDNETLEVFKWLLATFKEKVTILVVTYNDEIKAMATHEMRTDRIVDIRGNDE